MILSIFSSILLCLLKYEAASAGSLNPSDNIGVNTWGIAPFYPIEPLGLIFAGSVNLGGGQIVLFGGITALNGISKNASGQNP